MKWYAFATGDFSVGLCNLEIRKFKTIEKMERDTKAPYILKRKGPFFANSYKEAFDKIKKEWYN
jgi:hypothetical protein